MATHSSVLARRVPGTGEPGGLPSMGSRRVGHDLAAAAAAAAAMHLGSTSVQTESLKYNKNFNPTWVFRIHEKEQNEIDLLVTWAIKAENIRML